ncbi:TetR family transcriptional regulator [Denitratisoma oestradiolicum]|uniref:Putative HTH-type transcriptional regulator TtgR n=1 Tax=Denitratisoma oestradiolicum TaxID=311182 RepID=A0A6S6XVW3_9PROT|nr:TetR family transcriptional regulator [Denitratisoma oestradiolicum]TWO78832.1 hypothetical protein CBW56_17920 [Denitratisoma oestradiolicum]CAB1368353.1 putative HTH-type transcriptional regulator TtgR [Denitratisoma oestradiolicum]
MVRKRKEEADQTRTRIIESARRVFLAHGVSLASMDEIARNAGVTRGAIYWHFTGKRDILNVLCIELRAWLLQVKEYLAVQLDLHEPLNAVALVLKKSVADLENHQEIRKALKIILTCCEYQEDCGPIWNELQNTKNELHRMTELAYHQATLQNTLKAELVPEMAAKDTRIFIEGLVSLIVMTPFVGNASQLIDSHIDLRRRLPTTVCNPDNTGAVSK